MVAKVLMKMISTVRGMRYDLQGGGSDGATLWERELGSDICDAEGAGGVPPLGGSEDSRYVILVSRGRGT